MELLDEVAAQAEPLRVSTSDLVQRIRRRRRLAGGAAGVAVLVIALAATALQRPAPSEHDLPVAEPSPVTNVYERDSPFSCGQIITDLEKWEQNKNDNAMAVLTRIANNEPPLVDVGFHGNSGPNLVQILLLKGRVVVGLGVSIDATDFGGDNAGTGRGTPQVICPTHTWQQAWAGDDYEIVLLAVTRHDDPSPQLLKRGVLKRSVVKDSGIMKIHTHCGVRGFMYQGYWWEVRPKIDDGMNPPTGWDDPFQIGQIKKISSTEIEFTTPTGKQGKFRQTASTSDQASPCD